MLPQQQRLNNGAVTGQGRTQGVGYKDALAELCSWMQVSAQSSACERLRSSYYVSHASIIFVRPAWMGLQRYPLNTLATLETSTSTGGYTTLWAGRAGDALLCTHAARYLDAQG